MKNRWVAVLSIILCLTIQCASASASVFEYEDAGYACCLILPEGMEALSVSLVQGGTDALSQMDEADELIWCLTITPDWTMVLRGTAGAYMRQREETGWPGSEEALFGLMRLGELHADETPQEGAESLLTFGSLMDVLQEEDAVREVLAAQERLLPCLAGAPVSRAALMTLMDKEGSAAQLLLRDAQGGEHVLNAQKMYAVRFYLNNELIKVCSVPEGSSVQAPTERDAAWFGQAENVHSDLNIYGSTRHKVFFVVANAEEFPELPEDCVLQWRQMALYDTCVVPGREIIDGFEKMGLTIDWTPDIDKPIRKDCTFTGTLKRLPETTPAPEETETPTHEPRPERLCVTFVMIDLNGISQPAGIQWVPYGQDASIPVLSIPEGCEVFWEGEMSGITEDGTVTGTLRRKQFTVTVQVLDPAGEVFFSESQQVYYGENAEAPTFIAPEGYNFLWDLGTSFDDVREARTLTGHLVPKEYEVTFAVRDAASGEELTRLRRVANVAYGQEPTLPSYDAELLEGGSIIWNSTARVTGTTTVYGTYHAPENTEDSMTE